MDAIDQKKLDAVAKKIRAALESALKLARDAGVANPMLYIEAEGGIYIMDRDHPLYDHQGHERAKSVVGRIGGALPDYTDVGAW